MDDISPVAAFEYLGVANAGPIRIHTLDWYRKAASLGSADAQQRLTQLQN